MKKYLDIIIAIIAILAVAAFFVFLFDLAWFDRVAKMCSVWEIAYQNHCGATHRCAVLMANADVVGILASLVVFVLAVLQLFGRYKYWVLLIPVVGCGLCFCIAPFILCFI